MEARPTLPDTVPRMIIDRANRSPDAIAQYAKDSSGRFQPTTYQTLVTEVAHVAAGLSELGVQRGDHVALIADNRKEWLIADLAILGLGAVDIPRGTDTLPQELGYILSFSETKYAIVENEAQLQKVLGLKGDLPELTTIFLIDGSTANLSAAARQGVQVVNWTTIVDRGASLVDNRPRFYEEAAAYGSTEDTASIIFTSGTTGEPKGVMISHRNFLFQTNGISAKLHCGVGDVWLTVLPVWHSFERLIQYVALWTGSALAYSKPIGKIMVGDMEQVRPTWMTAVPRIWDAIRQGILGRVQQEPALRRGLFKAGLALSGWQAELTSWVRGTKARFTPRSRVFDCLIAFLPWLLLWPWAWLVDRVILAKVKTRLGGRFVAGISGGGALPALVDSFFAALRLPILEGYGLTESAPVISVRTQWALVRGTVGQPMPGTEVRVVDDEGTVLGPGQRGHLQARGGQVMKGYFKKPLKTREVIDAEGWLSTGDLAMLTYDNEIKIVGRAKDTIVLIGGENVEPVPIETQLQQSPFIEQAVVVGQDEKYLGALIVPNMTRLETWLQTAKIDAPLPKALEDSRVLDLYKKEIAGQVNVERGFRGFEQIARFTLLEKSFEVGKELSGKLDLKRHYIVDVYRNQVAALF